MLRRGIGRVGRPGVVGTVARTAVVAGTATAVSGGMMRHQQAKAEQAAQADAYDEMQGQAAMPAQAPPPPPPQPPPPAAGDDPVARLKQLADLHAAGALTDEEFSQAKAKLLGTG
jgi:Short C-terminal domain